MMGNSYVHYFDPAQNVTIPVTETKPLPVKVDTAITVDVGNPTLSVQGGYIGNGAQNNHFVVTTAGVEAKVGGTALANRHTITLINDSTYPIGIMVGSITNYAASTKLLSGNFVELSINPNAYVPVYLISRFFNVEIALIESSDG